MNEDKTRGMRRCVALLRLREIHQCINGHKQNKKARSTFVWTGSICPPTFRVNLAGRKGNGDDEIVGWTSFLTCVIVSPARRAENKEQGNIIPPSAEGSFEQPLR